VLIGSTFPQPTSVSSALRAGLALVLVGWMTGCYTFVPLVGQDPAPGEEVRLRLAAPAAQELSERMGVPVRSVEGPLVGIGPDSLVVNAGWGALYSGTVFEGRRDTLQFHRSQVLEVDRKELSRTRSAIVGAALIAGAVLLFRAVAGRGDPGDPGGGIPEPF
jgi:hypothetical protein